MLARIIEAPRAVSSSGTMPVTVARVPTGMKTGVSTVPRAVRRVPRRAFDPGSRAPGENEKAMAQPTLFRPRPESGCGDGHARVSLSAIPLRRDEPTVRRLFPVVEVKSSSVTSRTLALRALVFPVAPSTPAVANKVLRCPWYVHLLRLCARLAKTRMPQTRPMTGILPVSRCLL